MSLQLSLSVGPVDPQLVLRGSQSRQLVVVVQWSVVQRGEGLAVRVRAQVLEGPVVLQVAGYLDNAWGNQGRPSEWKAYLLLGGTLGGVVEGGRKVRRLEVGLQRLVVHGGRRAMGATVPTVSRGRSAAPRVSAGMRCVRRTAAGQP